MIKTSLLTLLALLFVFAVGGCVNPPYSTSGRVVVHDDHAMIDVAFSDHDRALIRDYYISTQRSNHKPLPPGLAKKGKVPPGHQKQMTRRGHLPPGLQYQSLPYELERRLTPIPDGYLRVMIDGSFILFNEHTKVIFDVFHAS